VSNVITFTTDLMFGSRISGAAEKVGVGDFMISTVPALQQTLDGGGVGLVLVDMAMPDAVAQEAITAAARHSSSPATVAYFSHVQTELRDAAIAAGAHQVMPRSQFVQELPKLLAQHCLKGKNEAR
jgi:DNA-binding NarL/FixJ family response regulator